MVETYLCTTFTTKYNTHNNTKYQEWKHKHYINNNNNHKKDNDDSNNKIRIAVTITEKQPTIMATTQPLKWLSRQKQ